MPDLTPAFWLWLMAALAATNAILAAINLYRRAWHIAAVSMIAAAVSAAVFVEYLGLGECAGTRGTVVDYYPGMTLCPGQSARVPFIIEIVPSEPGATVAPKPARAAAHGL